MKKLMLVALVMTGGAAAQLQPSSGAVDFPYRHAGNRHSDELVRDGVH